MSNDIAERLRLYATDWRIRAASKQIVDDAVNEIDRRLPIGTR